jgi:uncharacterized protein (DUF2062 family)
MNRLRASLRTVATELRLELEAALEGEYTPRQVAGSFALGVFITALPTLGVGVLAFLVIVWLFASVSKLALFASMIVLNPAVKWGVYGASFWLGSALLGPVGGIGPAAVSLSAAPEVVLRLLVGNLILAVILTVVGYAVAYRLTAAYQRRNGDPEPLSRVTDRIREPPKR